MQPVMQQPETQSPVMQPVRLFNRDFVLLAQGQLVSQMGSQLFTLAAYLWLQEQTGSATLVGLLGATASLPGLILGPFASTFADRFSRRAILIWSDVLRGVAVLCVAATAFGVSSHPTVFIGVLFTAVAVSSIASSFFDPAVSAALPDLVPSDKLTAANSVHMTLGRIARLAGPGLGGVAFRLLGAPWLFLFDGLSYLFSAFTEFFLRIPPSQAPPRTESLLRTLRADMAEGFRYILGRAGMKRMILTIGMVNFMVATTPILMPFYVRVSLAASSDWYGWLMAAIASGSLIGLAIGATVSVSADRRAWLLATSLAGAAAGYATLALFPSRVSALAGALLLGFSVSTFNIHMTTLLQVSTPTAIRGRVFGILGTLVGATAPLAMSLAGLVADANGQNIPPLFLICAAGVFLPTLFAAMDAEYRTFLLGGSGDAE